MAQNENKRKYSLIQIRRDNRDNLEKIFHISALKHSVTPDPH